MHNGPVRIEMKLRFNPCQYDSSTIQRIYIEMIFFNVNTNQETLEDKDCV